MKIIEKIKNKVDILFAILLIKPIESIISFGAKTDLEKVFRKLRVSSNRKNYFYIYSLIHQRATSDLISIIEEFVLEAEWFYTKKFSVKDRVYVETLKSNLGQFIIKLSEKVFEFKETNKTVLQVQIFSGYKIFSEAYIYFDDFTNDNIDIDLSFSSFEGREVGNINKLLQLFNFISSRCNCRV